MRNEARELRLSEGGGEQLERRLLELVSAAGEAGILQRDVWHLLNIDSRKGSRIIKRLEKMGLIARETVVHKGRRVYLLKPTKRLRVMPRLPDELEEIPCFYCPLLISCGDPSKILNCERMAKWFLDSNLPPK